MLEAARLLRFTDLTVGEIAFRAGYRRPALLLARLQAPPRRGADGLPGAAARALTQDVHTSARPVHSRTGGSRVDPGGMTSTATSNPVRGRAPGGAAPRRRGPHRRRRRPLRRVVRAGARAARPRRTTAHRAELGDGAETVLVLHEDRQARRAGRHAGLYHYALLYPSREELARAAVRLAATGTAIQGASDHRTHEAIYLADPDGNGIELAADRPREQWPASLGYDGGPAPLDFDSLLATVRGEPPAAARRRGPAHGPSAPARGRHRPRAGVLPRRPRLRAPGEPGLRRVPVRRRLPPPPRLQRLEGPRRRARARAHRRPLPLDRAAARASTRFARASRPPASPSRPPRAASSSATRGTSPFASPPPERKNTMDITIIGTGNMARGIATRALAGGATVTLLGRQAGQGRVARLRALRHRAHGHRRRPVDRRRRRARDPLRGARRRARHLRRPARRQGRRRHHQPRRLLDLHAAHPRGRLGRPGDRAARRPARRSSRRSTRPSPGRSSRARSRASRSTSCSPPTTRTPRASSARSSRTAACGRSTPGRSRAPTSSRPSATCTWRCSSRSGRASAAPSRSSRNRPRPGAPT